MAGTTIGEVNINLRMNLAQFSKDVQDGNSAAANGAKQLGRSMGEGTQQARESRRLLSDEIGIHMPRGLQTFIAEIPGVGTALNAAFQSVAVLALIELIMKAASTLNELKTKAEEFKKGVQESSVTGTQELRKLGEEVLQLEAQFAHLSGHTMEALKDELQLIDMQKLDTITKEFEDLDKTAQKTLDDLKVKGIADFFGMGNNQQVELAKKDLQDITDQVHKLQAAGDFEGIGKALDKRIDELKGQKDVTVENDPHPETTQKALNYEYQQLTQLKAEYTEVNAVSNLHKDIVNKDASQALIKEASAVTDLRIKFQDMVSGFKPDALDKVFDAAEKAENEVRKMAAENPALFKKAFPNDSVDTVIAAMQRFSLQAEDQAMLKALKDINKELEEMGKQKPMPDFGPLQTTLPTLAPGAKTPFSDQVTLQKISAQTLEGQKAAAQEAQKVIDGIETENQKFKDQAAILAQLKQMGNLTEEQFSAAMAKAAADTDKANKQWSNFGEAVGKDIEQTMLFGKSWSDSIKTILTQLIALIVQMTLLKSLQSSMGGGTGAGGFFSGLLGGLFGGKKASGGFVDSSHSYIVGENGPEMFVPSGGGNIVPNGSLSAGGGSTQVNYNIDARGADAGVEQRLREAIKESESRAVARAVITSQEISKRRL
jgi:hypothetical protein